MVRRASGHIVGVSSLGARRGLAWSAGYAASKAAMTTYLESLRPPLRKRGVLVTTAFPGFVRTAMTDALPLGLPIPLISADRAARHIVRAIRNGRREVSFPWDQALGAEVLRCLPAWAFDFVMTTVGRLAIKGDY
jgi:short-subunit dehydrogenase